MTQAVVAEAAKISPAELSRIERGAAPWVTIDTIGRVCAVVGLSMWVRLYPRGDAIRDLAHSRLSADFLQMIPDGVDVGVELPIGPSGDLRAWDLVLRDSVEEHEVGVEVETRITDVQALARRIQLKIRDSGVTQVLVVVRDTRSNRSALAAGLAVLGLLFPASSDVIAADLRAGRLPTRSGVLFVKRPPEAKSSRLN